MREYIIRYRCSSCGHKFKIKATSDDPWAADVADPDCPACGTVKETRGMDVGAGKAPSVGGSNIVKAMDHAAEITMQDYGMTDLKSDGREGAVMAPSLPSAQQAAADSMFASPKDRARLLGGRNMMPPSAQAAMRAAAAGQGLGAFARNVPQGPNPIELIHKAGVKPTINVIAGDGVRR